MQLTTPERPFPEAADVIGDPGAAQVWHPEWDGGGPGGLSPLRADSGWSFAAHVATELIH